MILFQGNVYETKEQELLLSKLYRNIVTTLTKAPLDPHIVINACHKISKKLEHGDYSDLLKDYYTGKQSNNNLLTSARVQHQIDDVIRLLDRETLLNKLKRELSYDASKPIIKESSDKLKIRSYKRISETPRSARLPLGVLFHIAAGNMEGLPAYSVIEGLLAGNINILKLPSVDNGITIAILRELIKEEPVLKNYIYVFDSPSSEIKTLKRLAKMSNAVVVWGGVEAIKAARTIADADTKIIEWGHKISFAYLSKKALYKVLENPDPNTNEMRELKMLACHIVETKQLQCSSCQGIYLDTNDKSLQSKFAKLFLTLLEEEAHYHLSPAIQVKAKITLAQYTDLLEKVKKSQRIHRGAHTSVTVKKDDTLETSLTHGNPWIKRLPKHKVIQKLHHYKGYLQTVGLLCMEDEQSSYQQLFARSGATRIVDLGEMSVIRCEESHDGEYPLQRYQKIVEFHSDKVL